MNIGELTATLGVDDSQLLTAAQSMKRYGAVVESRLKSTERSINRHIGLIKDIEDALTELRDERKDAFSIEEIERYNRKIAEAEQHLKEYEEAGIPAERQTDNLGSSFKQLAIKAIAAVAIWKTFKAVMESTSITATWFHSTIEGARTGLDYFMKSVATADFSGFVSGLRGAIQAGREYQYVMEGLGNISREYLLKELDLQDKIEEQRRIMYESDKTSINTKIKAGEEILNLLKQQADMEIELATKTYQAIAEKTGKKNKLAEDEIKYAIQHYTEIEKVGKEYIALEVIMDYVNGQIAKGTTARNDVIEAMAKNWVVLNDYTIKSVEDLEQAMKDLGAEAPTAGKLIEALGKMTEKEKDAITEAAGAVTKAQNQYLVDSRFIFRMIENLRDTSNKEQLKLIDEFYKEASRLHRLYLDQYADDIRKSTRDMDAPEEPVRTDYRKRLMMFSDVGSAADQVAAKLNDLAKKNAVFGDSFDVVGDQIKYVTGILNDLWERGLRPGIPLMDAYIAALAQLNSIENINNELLLAKMEAMEALAGIGIALVDRQIAKLDEQYKKDMKGAKNNASQKIKIEEEYHKKRNALIRKAAIIEKAAGLFSVLINTAKGVMAAASNPLTLPLIPWIKALGIIQAVAIAAAPLPGLAEGGIIPPGYPNDSYPAMLTSGERVTPPGKLDHQSSRLKVDSIEIDMHTLRIALSQTEAEYLETT